MTQENIYTMVFIAALFTVAKTWKQPKYPSIDDWMKIVYMVHTYSAIRKDEILPFATTWIDLEIIMLSKISQIEKAENHIISLVCEI